MLIVRSQYSARMWIESHYYACSAASSCQMAELLQNALMALMYPVEGAYGDRCVPEMRQLIQIKIDIHSQPEQDLELDFFNFISRLQLMYDLHAGLYSSENGIVTIQMGRGGMGYKKLCSFGVCSR